MRILIFWDSITEWLYDLESWWWVNRLKLYHFSKADWIEVANLWISWDTTKDLIFRFHLFMKAYTEKYNDLWEIIFSIWINDSIESMDGTYQVSSLEDFEKNIRILISMSQKYTSNITFLWLTKVDENIVCPFDNLNNWSCYKNKRIKEFDKIIEKQSKENFIKYIKMFDLLKNEDLCDWLHPNSKWHEKIFRYFLDMI